MSGGVGVRVLIVDDQATFRRAARVVIESTDGFTVAGEADSGESGVRLAASLRPDLVLMDVNLPGMDGFAATTLLRARSERIAVVLLSTREAEGYAGRADACGAVAYLDKNQFGPDTLADLWSRVRAT